MFCHFLLLRDVGTGKEVSRRTPLYLAAFLCPQWGALDSSSIPFLLNRFDLNC